MIRSRLLLAALSAMLISALPVCAHAQDTLPSLCAAGSHPRECWSNVRVSALMQMPGFYDKYPVLCTDQSWHDRLMRDRDEIALRVDKAGYLHAWQMPQDVAVVHSVIGGELARAFESCADSNTALAPRLRAAALPMLVESVKFARVAGNAERFDQEVMHLFTLAKQVLADPGAPPGSQEAAHWWLHRFCRYEKPEAWGREYPDYGRMMPWDRWHALGCDAYDYDSGDAWREVK